MTLKIAVSSFTRFLELFTSILHQHQEQYYEKSVNSLLTLLDVLDSNARLLSEQCVEQVQQQFEAYVSSL